MTYYNNEDEEKEYHDYKTAPSWISIILMMSFFWPVGVYLLIKRIIFEAEKPNGTKNRPYGRVYNNRNAKARQSGEGLNKFLNIAGIFSLFAAFSGFISISGSYYTSASEVILAVGLLLGGIGALVFSSSEKKQRARFQKYLTIIGQQKCVDISEVASKMPVSRRKAMRDLQEMINKDYFKGAYIDAKRNILVYSGFEPAPEAKEKVENKEVKKEKFSINEYQKYINDIKDVNNRIKHEGLSEQIYRIETISQGIFNYVSDEPEKQPMIRSFMQYYLPTTLKILNAYANFESRI